jgi:hypothetical protein
VTALHAILAVLATWRITHLIHTEDGPGDVVRRLRVAIGDGWIGKAVACFYCLSVWIAIPFAVAVGHGVGEILLAWPAFSGGAILLERLTTRETSPTPAAWEEDPPAP